MFAVILALLGSLLWSTTPLSQPPTHSQPSSVSGLGSSTQSGGFLLVTDPEYPQNEPGPTPTEGQMEVNPWQMMTVATEISNGTVGEQAPEFLWDPNFLVWDMVEERLEAGAWYRHWPVLDSVNLCLNLRGLYNMFGEIRLYPADYIPGY